MILIKYYQANNLLEIQKVEYQLIKNIYKVFIKDFYYVLINKNY